MGECYGVAGALKTGAIIPMNFAPPPKHLTPEASAGVVPRSTPTIAGVTGWEPTPSAGVNRSGCRVLVVDDDPQVRETNLRFLRRAGYDATAANDGEDGWAALRHGNFVLLLTDNAMPRLTGIELIGRMRAHGLTLPAILASGSLPWDGRAIPLELLPLAVLAKPYDFVALIALVRLAAGPHHSLSGAFPMGETRSALSPQVSAAGPLVVPQPSKRAIVGTAMHAGGNGRPGGSRVEEVPAVSVGTSCSALDTWEYEGGHLAAT